MKTWTSNLRLLLRIAMRDNAARFVVTEGRRDGVLVVRPTQELQGIGGRLAQGGILPADADAEQYEMLFEIERQDDPIHQCRYLHIRCRAGRRYAPMDVKMSVGWPVRNTDLVVGVLRRALREVIEGARAARASAASEGRGPVMDSTRPVHDNGGAR